MRQLFVAFLMRSYVFRLLTFSSSGGRYFSIHPSDMPTRTCRWTIHPFFPQTTTRSWPSGFVHRLRFDH